jgi:hypothetical protein
MKFKESTFNLVFPNSSFKFQLKISKDFSEFTCKQCESKITEFFNYRNTLLNIQEIWYHSFNEFIPIKEETKDTIFENFPIKMENQEIFDDYEDFKVSLFDLSISEGFKTEEKNAEPKVKQKARRIEKTKSTFSSYVRKTDGPCSCDICGFQAKKIMVVFIRRVKKNCYY